MVKNSRAAGFTVAGASAVVLAVCALFFQGAAMGQDTLSGIILERNDIFARHGYIFKSSALDRYYRGKSWYKPDKNFTWNRLTTSERKEVQRLLALEKKEVAKTIKKFTSREKGDTTRNFAEIETVGGLSSTMVAEIKSFMKKNNIHDEYYVLPESTSLVLKKELSKGDMERLFRFIKQGGQGDKYYCATYRASGRLKSVSECWYSEMLGEGVLGTWFFNERGNIVYISRAVPQTTLGSEWYFQYVNGNLVWFVFTIKSYAGSDYHVTRKFYP